MHKKLNVPKLKKKCFVYIFGIWLNSQEIKTNYDFQCIPIGESVEFGILIELSSEILVFESIKI